MMIVTVSTVPTTGLSPDSAVQYVHGATKNISMARSTRTNASFGVTAMRPWLRIIVKTCILAVERNSTSYSYAVSSVLFESTGGTLSAHMVGHTIQGCSADGGH